jgi:beta-glucosidase
MALAIRLRVDAPPEGPLWLEMGCGANCSGRVDLAPLLASGGGDWRTLKIKLSCLRRAGADMGRIRRPFVLRSSAAASVAVSDVRLATNDNDAVCPGG